MTEWPHGPEQQVSVAPRAGSRRGRGAWRNAVPGLAFAVALAAVLTLLALGVIAPSAGAAGGCGGG